MTLEKVLPGVEALVVPHPCIGTRKLKRATLLLAATYLTPRRRGFGLVHLVLLVLFSWFSLWYLSSNLIYALGGLSFNLFFFLNFIFQD